MLTREEMRGSMGTTQSQHGATTRRLGQGGLDR